MQDDTALLRSYADHRSEAAFAELVRRHLGLVYHAALRQTGGDPHRAQEIAQLVFTDLARKAADLARQPHLVAWLHTGVRYAASHLHRAEARRLAREQEAFAMSQTETAPEPAADWERLRPFIDEALESLGDRDRAAVLLRFFENRSYAEVAAALSVSDDAARVRVNRALEKLRATLARRGLVSTATALGLALAQPALAATPPGLAASITTASLSAAAAATAATATGASVGGAGGALSATTTAVVVMSTAKIALTTAGVLTLLSLGVALHQHRAASSHNSTFITPNSSSSALSPADLAAILHPARLSPADAAEALAAYLALPPLAPDAPQADYLVRAARLRALLTILPAEQHAQLLAATAARPGEPEDRLRRIAFTAWTELDAPAAARWALALAPSPVIDEGTARLFLHEAALAWGRDDFGAAYAWSESLAPGPSDEVGVLLIEDLAFSDPDRALSLARERGSEFLHTHRARLFAALAPAAPAAALRTFGADLPQTDFQYRGPALEALETWLGLDTAAAFDWLLARSSEKDPGDYSTLLGSVLQGLRPPPAACPALANLLLARTDLSDRIAHLRHFTWAWAQADAPAALAWLKKLPDVEARNTFVEDAMLQLGPDDFLAFASLLPESPTRSRHIRDYLTNFAENSPAVARLWFEQHRDLPEVAAAATLPERGFIVQLAGDDPLAALDHWEQLPGAADRIATAAPLALAWARRDPAAAAVWLQTLLVVPDLSDADREVLTASYGQSIGLLARGSPAELLRVAEEGPESLRAQAYNSLANDNPYGFSGALGDAGSPTSVPHVTRAELLASAPAAPHRDNALRSLIYNWLRTDHASARAWLETHAALPPDTAALLIYACDPLTPPHL